MKFEKFKISYYLHDRAHVCTTRVYNTCCCSAKIFKAEFIKRLMKT